MKTTFLYKLMAGLLLCLSVTGCSVPTIVATIASSTQVPRTAVPATQAPEDESAGGALTEADLTETVATENGVLTAKYPSAWTAEAFGTRLNLSNAPNLANEIGRRTFLPGELGIIVVYATRAEVAANFGFPQNFTLLDLASATSGGVANTASSSIEINGRDALAQTGEIGTQDILTDAYAITYEVDGIFVTLTIYAAPGMLNDIQGITILLASNLSVDASKLSQATEEP